MVTTRNDAPLVPVTGTRKGGQLGISAGSLASIEVLDACVDLGVGWVRVSHEYGWGGTIDALAKTVVAAKARGLKVIQCVQIMGKKYNDPVKNEGFHQFAADCAATGVTALEVGNEWNHNAFWLAPPYNVMPPAAQANLSASVAKHVRDRYPTLPIITNGLSPEASTQNPYLWLPPFWDVNLSAHKAAGWSGIGLHPYCYPELATKNPEIWNPMLQIPKILTDSRARGIDINVWLTEFGAPGFATNAPVIRGVALTEQRQVDCFKAYFSIITRNYAFGMKHPCMAIATMFDGQSATNSVEQGLGLRRADRSKKPVWYTVRDYANTLW